jgi:hypothetical protein
LNSRRGSGRWGAPASFGGRRRRTQWGGSEMRPSECGEDGVRGARRRLGHLTWARRLASCRACNVGKARVCAGAALLPWCVRRASPGAWGHLAGCGEGTSTYPGPTASAYDRNYADRVGNTEARRRRDVASRARERARRFRVALINSLKQRKVELNFKISQNKSCRTDN